MKKIISILFILAGLQTQAQQSNPELQNLIKQSLTFNPKLVELQQVQTISEIQTDLSKSYQYPNVYANASYAYVAPVTKINFPLGPNGEVETFQFQPNNNINSALNVNYVLLDFGKEKANIDRAKEELAMSKDNLSSAQNQLAAQVAQIYYGLIYLKKAIEVEDSVLDYLAYNKKITEDKLKNGDALQLDVLNIQALIDNENNRKADLENQRKKQINLLEYATGSIKSPTTSAFDFAAPNPTLDAAMQQATTNNPDFSLQQHKINEANFNVKFSRSDMYPQLSIGGSAGFKNGYLPELDVLKFNVVGSAAINLPIYSGMKARQQVQLAEANVKMNEYGMASLNAQYKKDISNALADIYSNNEHLKYSQAQIDETQLAKQITGSRYKNGVATYVDVQTATANYQRAQLASLQYSYQLCLANIELAKLTAYKYW